MGIVLGPAGLGLLGEEQLSDLQPLNQLALGLIALTVGLEFEWQRLRQLGRSVALVALLEAAGALVVVAVGPGIVTGRRTSVGDPLAPQRTRRRSHHRRPTQVAHAKGRA